MLCMNMHLRGPECCRVESQLKSRGRTKDMCSSWGEHIYVTSSHILPRGYTRPFLPVVSFGGYSDYKSAATTSERESVSTLFYLYTPPIYQARVLPLHSVHLDFPYFHQIRPCSTAAHLRPQLYGISVFKNRAAPSIPLKRLCQSACLRTSDGGRRGRMRYLYTGRPHLRFAKPQSTHGEELWLRTITLRARVCSIDARTESVCTRSCL